MKILIYFLAASISLTKANALTPPIRAEVPEDPNLEAYEAVPELSNETAPVRYNTLWGEGAESLASKQSEPDVDCRDITKSIRCDASARFRTIDGTCNNLKNPYWGSSYTPFQRIVANAYDDGKSTPRGSSGNLPFARKVSTTMHSDSIRVDKSFTHAFPLFGQFLAHDISFGISESGFDCCGKDRNNSECTRLDIPRDDPFYSSRNVTCIGLTRAKQFCVKRSDGVREQVNVLTHFIDLSALYGSNPDRARQLRSGKGGRLQGNPNLPNLCPSIDQMKSSYGDQQWKSDFDYFATGDPRTNENPMLVTWHNLFFREHNKLAAEIQNANPRLNDEEIYQNARRILGAVFQKIVYNDFLPLILGQRVVDNYRLRIDRRSSYSENVMPLTIQGFATSAFRFGHGLVSGSIVLARDDNHEGTFQLRDELLKSRQVIRNNGKGFHLMLNGMLSQYPQRADRFVTQELTNFLFKPEGRDFGSDLIARNIQRARDQGVPAYSVYRKACGLEELSNWDNRPAEISSDDWKRFQSIYINPRDIDLFSGGLVEEPRGGAIVGPTFACLIGYQFHGYKYGDRFFFTHVRQRGSFTLEQRDQIRSVTLGDIICRNSDISSIPNNVFRPENKVSCQNRKYLDVSSFL